MKFISFIFFAVLVGQVAGYSMQDPRRIVSCVCAPRIQDDEGGFIPNLFTPNDDGNNDQLKIYGIASANDFVLSIYDREGTLVFETSDIIQAVQQGWDGTTKGTRQPAGVYFWKVTGEMASGETLLLNGKDSGSIVLVR